MIRRYLVLLCLLVFVGPTLAAPGANKSNPGQPFQQLSNKLDQNAAQLGANSAGINQAIAGIKHNAEVIQDIPRLTVEAFGEGSTRWVSPFWREAFADNINANTSVNVLNLAGRTVDSCVIFRASDGTVMQSKLLVIDDQHLGQVEFVNAGGVSSRGWVEVVSSDNVLVEGAIFNATRSGGDTLGVRERSMTWYALAPGGNLPPEVCVNPQNPDQ